MKIYSFYNDKGGVGKTALAVLTAQCISLAGYKTLLIDNDSQANLSTTIFKCDPELEGFSNFLSGQIDILNSLYNTFYNNLSLCPYGTIKEVTGKSGILLINKLKEHLSKYFDILIFDQQPRSDHNKINYFTNNISDVIIIPTICDDQNTMVTVKSVFDLGIEMKTPDIRIIRNLFRKGSLYSEYSQKIENFFNKNEFVQYINNQNFNNSTKDKLLNAKIKVLKTIIHDSVEVPTVLRNADNVKSKLIYTSNTSSPTTQSFKNLCLEIFDFLEENKFLDSLNNEKNKILEKVRFKSKNIVKENVL